MALRRREVLILGTVGAAAAGTGLLAGTLLLQSRSGAATLLAAPFPDLAGRTRRLMDWQGQVLVCNFWATWCAPCREEMPMLAKLRENFGPKGVEVVGIGIDSGLKIAEFIKEHPVGYPILVADAGAIDLMRDLGNPAGALPYTVVLDRAGAIGYSRLGVLAREDFEKVLVGFLR